jgi:hypothetical protein
MYMYVHIRTYKIRRQVYASIESLFGNWSVVRAKDRDDPVTSDI